MYYALWEIEEAIIDALKKKGPLSFIDIIKMVKGTPSYVCYVLGTLVGRGLVNRIYIYDKKKHVIKHQLQP